MREEAERRDGGDPGVTGEPAGAVRPRPRPRPARTHADPPPVAQRRLGRFFATDLPATEELALPVAPGRFPGVPRPQDVAVPAVPPAPRPRPAPGERKRPRPGTGRRTPS